MSKQKPQQKAKDDTADPELEKIVQMQNQVEVIFDRFEDKRTMDLDIQQLYQKMDKDIEYNKKKKQELEYILQEQKLYYDKQLKDRDEDKVKEIDRLILDKEEELRKLKYKYDELNIQLQPLRPWAEEEEELNKRIEELKQDERNYELKHYDEKQKQDRNFSKLRYKIESISTAKIDDIKKSAAKVAEKTVKDQELERKMLNQQLREGLNEHHKKVEQMKKERDILMEQNKQYKLNLNINKEGILEYQHVNQKQQNQIKKYKEKVESLKNQISDEVSRFTKEVEFLKIQHNQRKQDIERDIKYVKEQLKIRSLELKNVKQLASIIVEQKSDIENFFLEALQNVRDEIKKRIQIQKKQNQQQGSRLPDLSSQAKSLVQEEQKSSRLHQDKLDIADLDIEEKEKLLRILFSKMNSGIQPMQWVNNKFETSSIHDDSHMLQDSLPQF